MNLLTFEEALEKANGLRTARSGKPVKKHLLLGNGFSIALRPDIFTYGSLFEKIRPTLQPQLTQVFGHLGTSDFEEVIQGLESAAALLPFYADSGDSLSQKMLEDARALKEALVTAIASNHPARPGDISDWQYDSCKDFLYNFISTEGDIYTLNYDILLYWVLMHSGLSSDDGFRTDPDEPDADYVFWNDDESHSQKIYYLHGALHLSDAGHQLRKYTWNRTDVPLIDQARDAISQGAFPLFVSEGASIKKLIKIRHSDYLHRGYKRLTDIGGCLFSLGWSLAPNDHHILQKLTRSKISNIFVGIHGDPEDDHNQATIESALRLDGKGRYNNLTVSLYDSSSANVWG